MAFRADESATRGFESVLNYLISKNVDAGERERSKRKLIEIVNQYGPVVDGYPSWHPLVSHCKDDHCPSTCPSSRCGYLGLDHTRNFANAFITCPYGDGQDVIDSVEELPHNPVAIIRAERLDVKLYHSNANPILVSCNWVKSISPDGMIPASVAIPLMLQKELPSWEWAQRGETWETMRPYFLGSPHGSRSSLFVNQETGATMKKIWTLLIDTGMFGPVRG